MEGEVRRLRPLEAENHTLKQLLAEATLDNHALQELLRKKLVTPAARREAVRVVERQRNDGAT